MKPLALLALSLTLAAPAAAQSLSVVQVAQGLSDPTFMCSPPGDFERMFVTSSNGQIFVIKNGVVLPTEFLDLTGLMNPAQGLLGMAFHPDYATNGRFFVCYMDVNQETWLVEYSVSADPDVADPASATTLLGPEPQLEIIHNWNCLQFGPDGMMYFSTGDGGGAFNPTGSAQDLGSILGKILRLDVDVPAPYVPADNPFVGQAGAREEIWAYGLRQPWRFSFDSQTGDLYIADVGEGSWEEINFQPAGSPGGENYGWRCMEGDHCTGQTGCTCDGANLVDPILEYSHSTGCAIIGGAVYRGSGMPFLHGAYVYADFCTGSFWTFRYDGATLTDFQDRTAEIGGAVQLPTSFGVDAAGELYVLDRFGGRLFKFVDGDCTADNYCMTSPNSFGPGATVTNSGSLSVANNTFNLDIERAVPGQFGIFYYGTTQTQVPFGDGFRCITGQTFRIHPPVTIEPFGVASQHVDFTSPPQLTGEITAGSTWNFQFWYRDPAAGGAGFNLSNAITATFCP